MYLKSLELSGFKSFAKKATLNFTSPITAIVGPNGSGKSNVAESFRFVLGEQSIKSLRGKRGEDMIWNGGGDSNGSSRSNRASVKLVFDNSRRFFDTIDFDQVSIERTVHRDNANEYSLNGSLVRLRDIVELLGAAHIGASGHQIISQGEADRILSASEKERRDMIEDALGLKVYQWKKTESLKKLEKTEENVKQVESLRREIAPHIKFLKKQCERAEKAQEMKRELVSTYKDYFSKERYYIKSEKERISLEIAGPRKKMSDLEKEMELAKKTLSNFKGRDGKSEEVLTLERKLASVRDEKDSINRELGRLEGEISANERALKKRTEAEKREESTTVYLKDVEGILSKVESLGSIVDAKKLWAEVVSMLKDFINARKHRAEPSFLEDISAEISKLFKQKSGLEQRLERLSSEEHETSRKYKSLKSDIEEEKDINREAEKNVFKIIAEQNEVRSIISRLEKSLEAITMREEALKHELGEAGAMAGREAVNFAEISSGVVDLLIQAEMLKKIERLKIRIEDAGGSGGEDVLKEFRETEERDSFLARELEDLEKSRQELLNLIADLEARIDVEFKSGILKINDEFGKYFTLMFGGGHAELSVVKEKRRKKRSDQEELRDLMSSGDNSQVADEHEEEAQGPEGLEVNVSLPRKKVKGLMMLSGGERALTSIALLFAISQVNPPPFIILDETDAALDEANSKKYGDMIENLAKKSQLIVITHNRETMSRAGVLYGVTMGADGASRLLSIQFDQALAVAK